MTDKQIDELIERALKAEQTLPEGLSRRLEEQIDRWEAQEEKGKQFRLHKHSLFYWIGGIAASLLLCVGVFFHATSSDTQNKLADTYTDPQEAAIAAEKALLLLSDNLNKGFAQVNEAGVEIRKVNNLLNKHLND